MSSRVFCNGRFLTCTAAPLPPCLDDITAAAYRWVRVSTATGLIEACGESDEPAEHAGLPRVDLGGRTVLPGLADAHLHVLATGKARCTVDFRECRSIDDMRAALIAWVAQHPVADGDGGDASEPLLGEGWAQDAMGGRYPTAADFAESHLPRHIAARPLVLYRACHHICVCNDVALKLLGIDAARADPPGGRIDRLPHEEGLSNTSTSCTSSGAAAVDFGRPSGILRETAADLSKALSASTPAARLRYIERGLAECLAAGVTSVQTNDWSAWPQYCALADADRLPMRVYLTIPAVEIDFAISPKAGETRGSACRAANPIGSESSAGSMGSSTVGGAGPMLECHRVKLFADGSLGAETAALSAPYVEIHRCAHTHAQQRADGDGHSHDHSHDHDHSSHEHGSNAESAIEAAATIGGSDEAAAVQKQNTGLLLYTQEQLTAEIRRARDHGFRLEIHVIGDRAAEVALNALRDGGSLPHERPILTHCQVLRADLIERMVAAGVVADVQPQFVLTDSAWVDRRLPAPLLPFAYAWRTLLARGIVCAGGSDSPIEVPAPLVGMHAAMRRPAAPACVERTFRAAECLTFAQALWMYTSGAAYCAGKEHVFGLLKEGYSADFVVLSSHADVTPLPSSFSFSSSSSSSSFASSSPRSPSTPVSEGVSAPASDPAAAVNMFDAHPERLLQCRVEQVWIAGSQRL